MKKRYHRVPYKELGNGALASSVFLAAHFLGGFTLGLSVLMGGACYLGYRLLFGTDLSRDDLWEGLDKLTAERAIAQLTTARIYLEQIQAHNEAIPHPALTDKMNRLGELGEKIIQLLESNPRDMNRAKRFIDVYLQGAVSVSKKFAELHAHANDAALDRQFGDFLQEMITAFEKQHTALLEDEKLDLDVEIEVLQKRLKSEAYYHD